MIYSLQLFRADIRQENGRNQRTPSCSSADSDNGQLTDFFRWLKDSTPIEKHAPARRESEPELRKQRSDVPHDGFCSNTG
jgi:hypothetical protein